mmetsp:Transcript_39405/g.80602  ORF Transcript_39405/g.80602 Transcript_39405/m.80602 type:complete len:249 (-) Transcript_39405:847-1593(-)
MRQSLHLVLALLALNHLNIGSGTALRVLLGKEVNAQGVAVESGQGNELPAESELGKVPNEGLHLSIGHSCTVPVEGWAQVVCKHLVWHCSTNLLGKLSRLSQNWLASLHPDAVRIWGEGNGTLNAELSGALDSEVAFHRASRVPVKVDVAAHACGSFAHLVQGHLASILEPLGWVLSLSLQGLGDGIGEGHASSTLLPVLVSSLPHCLVQRFHALDGDTLDVRMINGINVAVNHRGCLPIGTRHQHQR